MHYFNLILHSYMGLFMCSKPFIGKGKVWVVKMHPNSKLEVIEAPALAFGLMLTKIFRKSGFE